MQIHGLSKLTLLDYPAHLACTVFTGTCNFRCPFCHNASLVLTPNAVPSISETDFFNFLESRKEKLDGVCITGGEPTLQKDLPEFIRCIRSMGFLVKLDTNGYQPEVLHQLISEGLLDMAAMDIKNAPSLYAKTCGIPEQFFRLTRIEESVSLLISSGIPFEFRTTIVRELHGEEQIQEMGIWLSGLSSHCSSNKAPAFSYYLQGFKSTDSLVCGQQDMYHAHTQETMQHFQKILCSYIPHTKLRGC